MSVPRTGDTAHVVEARLRDDIGALNRAMEKQQVVLGDGTDADVVAFAQDELEAAVQVFHVRGGRVRGQRGWIIDKVEDVSTGQLVEQFLLQVYGGVDEQTGAGEVGEAVPREVLVPELPDDADVYAELLSELRGSRVSLRVPQRGRARAGTWGCLRRCSCRATPCRAAARWARSSRRGWASGPWTSGSRCCRCTRRASCAGWTTRRTWWRPGRRSSPTRADRGRVRAFGGHSAGARDCSMVALLHSGRSMATMLQFPAPSRRPLRRRAGCAGITDA